MSWRDRFSDVASFRGVVFRVQSHRLPLGRSVQVHTYPGRDDAYPEDLGGIPLEFTIEALVIGLDYDLQRDRLIEACNRSGHGTLVHPYYGTLEAVCQPGSMTESTREGGLARFSLKFVRWSPPSSPRASAATSPAVMLAADGAIASATEDFLRVWSVSGLPGFVEASAVKLVKDATSVIESQVKSVTGYSLTVSTTLRSLQSLADAAAAVRDPERLVAEMTARIRDASGMGDVNSAIRFARRMSNWGDDHMAVPGTTRSRQAEARNQAALQGIVRRTSLAEMARLTQRAELGSRDEALALRGRMFDEFEAEITAAGDIRDDAAYLALRDLQSALVRDLDARGARLPSVATVTPAGPVPSLVAAHRYYGDVSREAELVAHNGIRHPGFIPGGSPLEILVSA